MCARVGPVRNEKSQEGFEYYVWIVCLNMDLIGRVRQEEKCISLDNAFEPERSGS